MKLVDENLNDMIIIAIIGLKACNIQNYHYCF